MQLLASVNAGFSACPNGWVELYIRGSSTRATWYSSFEGDGANSTGANITLDAYGSAEIYVNQLVDVVVKQSDGTLYREYTDGYASPNVEVISQSFTGTDYVTAASAASEPTTLQAVLDLWKTNSGAIDWKVLINGTSTTLLNAFGSLAGLVYNVKSPAYGAVGDGVNNDQTAIQAALAAAVAAGGGVVFFPRGTYLITTAIEWDHRVSMLGVGADGSILTTNSPSNASLVQLTAGSGGAAPIAIAGMSFAATQANTGSQFSSSVAVNLVFSDVHFGQSTNCTGKSFAVSGASKVTARECTFTINGTANSAWSTTTTTMLQVSMCKFVTTGTNYTPSMLLLAGRTTLCGCYIDYSSVTGTTPNYCIEVQNASDYLAMTGVEIYSSSGYPVYGLRMVTGCFVNAAGNVLGAFTGPYSMAGGSGSVLGDGSYLEMGGKSQVASALTAFTVPEGYAAVGYRLTSTVPTFTMPRGYYLGQRLTLLVENKSGVAWGANVTFSSGASVATTWGGAVSTAAADSQMVIGEWVFLAADSSTPVWNAVSLKIGSA